MYNEADIINKIQSGDINAFREIVDEYKDKAFSLTVKILKNRAEAEDSLQEAFIKLYKAISDKQFKSESKLSTYFFSIVYNTAVDSYRKYTSKQFNITSIDVTDSSYKEGDELVKNFRESDIDTLLYARGKESTDSTVIKSEIQKIIEKYIRVIPEHYSIILNMFYVNDLSHNEISDILKLPLGTVKNRIFRAKEKLREILLKKFPAAELMEYSQN